MLTRVYGTAFFSRKDLDEYLERLERARANDHRRLGPQLGLFTFSDVSPGAAVLAAGRDPGLQLARRAEPRDGGAARLHRGQDAAAVRQLAVEDLGPLGQVRREHVHHRVRGPADGAQADELPRSRQLYSLRPHSYRDLPVRYSEPGLLHRDEPSGTLHGLLRARHFAQDDAHIFCTEEQIQDEVAGCLEFAFATYAVFGIDVRLELSTRPENRIGSDELWDQSEAALVQALESQGLAYDVNEGDGAFYGPKIDMHMTDSLGRSWQLGTVQLDYNMPARFGLTYTGADNAEHQPVMIHRALMGSYERFIGILLEHLVGRASGLADTGPGDRAADRRPPQPVRGAGRRARCRLAVCAPKRDERSESVSRKIRDAELRKIPFMLVVGDREQETRRRQRARAHGRRYGVGDDRAVFRAC